MKIVLVRLAVLTAVCSTLDHPNVAFNSVEIFASPFVYRFSYFIAQRSTVFNITTAIYIFFYRMKSKQFEYNKKLKFYEFIWVKHDDYSM